MFYKKASLVNKINNIKESIGIKVVSSEGKRQNKMMSVFCSSFYLIIIRYSKRDSQEQERMYKYKRTGRFLTTRYADHTLVITDNIHDLQVLIQQIYQVSRKYDLEMNEEN